MQDLDKKLEEILSLVEDLGAITTPPELDSATLDVIRSIFDNKEKRLTLDINPRSLVVLPRAISLDPELHADYIAKHTAPSAGKRGVIKMRSVPFTFDPIEFDLASFTTNELAELLGEKRVTTVPSFFIRHKQPPYFAIAAPSLDEVISLRTTGLRALVSEETVFMEDFDKPHYALIASRTRGDSSIRLAYEVKPSIIENPFITLNECYTHMWTLKRVHFELYSIRDMVEQFDYELVEDSEKVYSSILTTFCQSVKKSQSLSFDLDMNSHDILDKLTNIGSFNRIRDTLVSNMENIKNRLIDFKRQTSVQDRGELSN